MEWGVLSGGWPQGGRWPLLRYYIVLSAMKLSTMITVILDFHYFFPLLGRLDAYHIEFRNF